MAKRSREKRERRYSSAKKRVETHKTGFDRTSIKVPSDATFFVLDRAGTRRIDVLPYLVGEGNPFADEGELHYERTYYIHRGVGANQDSYVCPAKTAKKPCPICEYRMKLMKSPEADEDQIKDLAPKERQLWNVIDREASDKGVQLWDISFHLFGKLLDTEIRNADEDEDYDTFFHLENGKTLKLGIGEKSFGGRTFCEVETISFKPRPTDYDDDVLDKCHSLDDLPIVLEYDKLKAIFLQTTEAEEEEEEEDKPKSRKPKEKVQTDERDDELDEEPEISVEGIVRYKGEKCEVLRVGEDGKLMLEGLKSEKTYKGVDADDLDSEEEEDDKPQKTAKSKTKTPPKKEEEDDWDNMDDEDEPPKKTKPKSTKDKKDKKDKTAKTAKTAKTDEEEEEEEEEGNDDDWDNWD